ncbi:uncharacterized protein BDZ99DRAFT_513343 [Mytilinidion resinicola]|uniref:Uncharacterized protein n=1 Tax=Mytilinidion resinicola TaxID=574789 RepID=A0A6A6Z9Y2_9PEZI|nr:uncharacterized protein BDZ99DRAFT_513343 [Mytilinidion resinicola]KAF2817085.1 hypothetical protein BDZ99DRAFT_513343 [Mytilinidion resinicola]
MASTTMPSLKHPRSDHSPQSGKRRRLAGRNLEEKPALLDISMEELSKRHTFEAALSNLHLVEPERASPIIPDDCPEQTVVTGFLYELSASRPATYQFAKFPTHDAGVVYGFGGYNCPSTPSATGTGVGNQSQSGSNTSAPTEDGDLYPSRYRVYRGLGKRRRDIFEIQQGPGLPLAKRQVTTWNHVRRLFLSQFPQVPVSRKRVLRDEAELKEVEEVQRRVKRRATYKDNVKTFSTLMHRVPQEVRDMIFANVVREPNGLRYDPSSNTVLSRNGSKRTTVLEKISPTISRQSRNVHLKTNQITFPNIFAYRKAMEEMPQDQKESLRHIKVYGNWAEPYWREFLVVGGRNVVRTGIDELLQLYNTLPALKSITMVIHAWNWGTRREFDDSSRIAEILTELRGKGELPSRKKLAIVPLIGDEPEIPYTCWGDNSVKVDEETEKEMVAAAKKWVRNED